MRKLLLSLTIVGLFALAFVPSARADTITFDLSNGNPAISGYTGPYIQVKVDWTDSTHATITFTSLTNSGNIYLMGDGGSVALNVNATTFTVGTITGTNSGTGFSPGPYSTTSGQEDGWGQFNLQVDSHDGYTSSANVISFTITNTSGTWANASDVLTPNDYGNSAAAHVFVTTSPADASNSALATGYASNGQPVPEPASLLLLGSGLLGLGGIRLRRKGAHKV